MNVTPQHTRTQTHTPNTHAPPTPTQLFATDLVMAGAESLGGGATGSAAPKRVAVPIVVFQVWGVGGLGGGGGARGREGWGW